MKTSFTPRSFRTVAVHVVALSVALTAIVVRADHFYTNNATGDFNVANYWNPNGIPNDNTHNNNGSNNVVLIQAGDPLWQHGDTLAGDANGASGAYLQTGSTNNTGGGNWLRMGLNVGAFGSYVLSNGLVNVGGRIQIGENGVGYLEISGGTMKANVNDTGTNPGLAAGQGNFAATANNFPVGTVVINSGTLNIGNGEVWFGNGNNNINSRGTGHFIMHGGTFNANNWFVFGRFGAAGDGYMDGGVINKNNNGNVQIGVGSMNSGTTPGQGYFTQLGGTFNCASQYQVGTDAAITQATNIIAGNAILIVDNWLAVGRNGANGVLIISNSAAITKTGVNAGNLSIGAGGGGAQQNSSVGVIEQSGGTFTNTATQTWIGETGQGTWNMNSGTTILGTVLMADTASGSGTLNLAGGLFRVASISSPNPGASTTLNFNGGTLQASADNLNFITSISAANVQAGGAVIDSQGFNVGIPQALNDNGGGGLTKLGSGTLTLSGANTYTGNTAVNAGTVATTTATSGGGSYTVADSATLGVTVESAGAQLGMASATFASSTAATLNIDVGAFGNPTAAPVNVSGNLAVNGAITVNVADGFPQLGQFSLIKYGSKTGSGSFVLGSLPVGVTATLSNYVANSSIDLVISGVNQPRWDGQAGGTWDKGADTNWVNIGTGLPTTYSDPSSVVFDDNALGTTTVNLTTTVNPSSVSFNNNSLPYILSGTGKISGAASMILNGLGTVSILNTGSNNFTGRVILNNGTLTVTNLANGGLPSPIGASSANPTNLVFSGGGLNYSGPAVSINRGYSVQLTNGAINTASNLTLSGSVTAALAGGFTKSGLAQLTYTTAGTNVLTASGSSGYIVTDGTVVFDGSSGGQTNTVGGARFGVDGQNSTATVLVTNAVMNLIGGIDLGDQANTTAAMTVDGTNSTVTLGSWLIFGDGGNVTSTLNMNNGTLNVNSGKILMGGRPGDTSTFNMNGGVLNNNSGNGFDIADGGWNGSGARTATVNQSGGAITCGNNTGMSVGNAVGGTGFYNLTNGTLTLAGEIDVGNGGAVGTLNIFNGSLTANNWFTVGRAGSSDCVLNMTGGTINKNNNGAFIIGTGAGNNSLANNGTFNISAGTVSSTGEFWIAENNGSTGTNNISGTASMNIHNWVTVGRGGLGAVNMTGGQFNSDTQPFIVGIFGNGQGFWNQSAGTVSINTEIWIAQGDPTATGTINLDGGTITNTSWLAVGREGGSGVFNIDGGTYVRSGPGGGPNGPNVSIAHGGGTGTVNVNSGYVDVSAGDTWVGEDSNTGTWNMNGGTAKLAYVQLARNANANGVMTLNAGSLTSTEITTGNTNALQRELDFNGGTLVAGANNANFIHDLSAANVQAGGAVFDTAGHTVAVNQALLDGGGGGGLTKNGAGTLALNGINTYSGPTLVSAGTLGGNGSIAGTLSISGAGTLAPGNSVGTFTVNNNATLGGTTLMEVSKNGGVPTSDLLNVTGNLGFGGSLTVVINSTNTLTVNDTFNLFDWGTESGTFSAVNLPAGYTWDSSQLYVNGTIRVTAVTPARVNPPFVSGGNFILTGVGGPAGSSYTWLTHTNIASPVATWTTSAAGIFDANGIASNAVPKNAADKSRFFRLRTP
jgi:autotransporter-associated beta strand protein